MVALRRLGYRCTSGYLRRYATVLRPIAEKECAVIEEFDVLDEAVEATVAYTMLYEPIILSLRRRAHEDVSARRHRRDQCAP